MKTFPYIINDSYGTPTTVDIVSELYSKRTILLFGTITDEKANEIMLQLLHLKYKSEEPVKMLINSHGGEINAGLLIYDVLSSLKADVDMYCTGQASSMAAWILASGKKGHRYILQHSHTMIHEPRLMTEIKGAATDIKNMSKSALALKNKMNRILAKHTGHSLKEINRLTMHDHYMDAEESVRFGICDKIVDDIY